MMINQHFAVALGLLLGAMAIGPASAAGPASPSQGASNTAQAAPAAPGVTKQHVVGGDDQVRNEREQAQRKPLK